MNKEINYRQCCLEKDKVQRVAWIPEQFAILNKFLKLRFKKNIEEDGWRVKRVGEYSLSEGEAKIFERNYKHHRVATDI